MNSTKHIIRPNPDPEGKDVHHGRRPPKPLHHDWRFWVGAVLVLAAMFTYVTTENLAWRPARQPPPPLAEPAGK
jgi:hypothetical protein